MAIRSLVLASLLAAASAAQAGPIAAVSASAAPATWTISSAAGNISGSLSEIADFVASGAWSSSQAWSLFSSENASQPVAEMFAPSSSLMMLGFNNFNPVADGSEDGLAAAQVPEPGSIALLLAALGGFCFMARRRSR